MDSVHDRAVLLAWRHALLPVDIGLHLRAVTMDAPPAPTAARTSNASGRFGSASNASGRDARPRPAKQLCSFFSERGSCRNGSACLYVHEHGSGAALGLKSLKKQPLRTKADCLPFIEQLKKLDSPDLRLEVLCERRDDIGRLLGSGLPPRDFGQLVDLFLSVGDAFQKHLFEKVLDTLALSFGLPLAEYLPKIVAPKQIRSLLQLLLRIAIHRPAFARTLVQEDLRQAWIKCKNVAASDAQDQLAHEIDGLLEGLQSLRDNGRLPNDFQFSQGHTQTKESVGRSPGDLEAEDASLKMDMVLPSLEELLKGMPKDLPKNRIREGWEGCHGKPDLQKYRCVHFQLLREEMLSPLRDAMAAFLGVSVDSSASAVNFFAYEVVHTLKFGHSMGWKPCLTVQFTSRYNVDFSAGSHLIYGSLVALFEVDEQRKPIKDTLLFATVEEFSIEKVTGRQKEIGLAFLDPTALTRFDFERPHIMLESPSYFAAFNPVFEWLTDAHVLAGMPLVNELLGSGTCRASDEGVDYIGNTRIDISPLYREIPKSNAEFVELGCFLPEDVETCQATASGCNSLQASIRAAVEGDIDDDTLAVQISTILLSGAMTLQRCMTVFMDLVEVNPAFTRRFGEIIVALSKQNQQNGEFASLNQDLLNACQTKFEVLQRRLECAGESSDVVQLRIGGLAFVHFLAILCVKKLLACRVISSILKELLDGERHLASFECAVDFACEVMQIAGPTLSVSSASKDVASLTSKIESTLQQASASLSDNTQSRMKNILTAQSEGWPKVAVEMDDASRVTCMSPLSKWPNPELLELDASQQAAVHHALRNRIAVIQGPPGTGKSYVGVKLVRLLQQVLKQQRTKAPIMVVCLTNHALDQFLEDLFPFYPSLIRLGGRSKSENAKFLDQQLSKIAVPTQSESQEMRRLREEINSLLRRANISKSVLDDPLVQATCLTALLPQSILQCIPNEVRGLQKHLQSFHMTCTGTLSAWLEAWHRGEDNKFDFECKHAHRNEVIEDALSKGLCGFQNTSSSHVTAHISEIVPSDIEDLDLDIVQSILADRTQFEECFPNEEGIANSELEQADLDKLLNADRKRALTNKLAEMETLSEKIDDWEARIAEAEQQRRMTLAILQDWEGQKPTSRIGKAWQEWSWWHWDTTRRLNLNTREVQRLRKQERSVKGWRGRLATVGEQVQSLRLEVAQNFYLRYFHLDGSLVQEFRAAMDALPSASLGKDLATWAQADREALWTTAVELTRKVHRSLLCSSVAKAQQASRDLEQVKKTAQLRACGKAPLIGMTSTFAALNRDLVHRIGSHVAIVEEAGELLEVQLMASLSSPNLQHLILIGDHRQLRPKLNAHHLVQKCYFDVSLFERRIRLGHPMAQLSLQLRMSSSICDLVRGFYDQIVDHPRVDTYPSVGGLGASVVFCTHSVLEDSTDNNAVKASKRNSHEAMLACRLVTYLVQQKQYEPCDITLLTPYLGQKRLMLSKLDKELKSKSGHGVKVATIDDYQGEENKVVILSLVRSNKQGKIGFCGIENRVIVALSRAQHGLYILGNKEMLKNSKSWSAPLSILEEQGLVRDSIPIKCQTHPDTVSDIMTASDFDECAPDGGCALPCQALLPRCGHLCPLRCHPCGHERVICGQRCSRPRPEGCTHHCRMMCHECPGSSPETMCQTECTSPVSVSIQACGHIQDVPCHLAFNQQATSTISCEKLVSVRLDCGHTLSGPCKDIEPKRRFGGLQCTFKEMVTLDCGHMVKRQCGQTPICKERCTTKHPCGHACDKTCGLAHSHEPGSCNKPCPLYLMCGHKCASNCGGKCTDKCMHDCGITCTHGYKCSKKCWEACVPCRMPCDWECEHYKCTRLCNEECDRPPCEEPCRKTLSPCGHPCRGLCGEPCPPCPICKPQIEDSVTMTQIGEMNLEDRLYRLPDCDHTFFLETMDQYMSTEDGNDGHVSIQLKGCPVCRKPILTASRYNAITKRQLRLITAVKERITLEERRAVDSAMRSEGSLAGGHWYACPRGHPYYIGECGGAMQLSVCPEPGCGLQIGGGSHRLVDGNQYLSNFTGESIEPAWPGAA